MRDPQLEAMRRVWHASDVLLDSTRSLATVLRGLDPKSRDIPKHPADDDQEHLPHEVFAGLRAAIRLARQGAADLNKVIGEGPYEETLDDVLLRVRGLLTVAFLALTTLRDDFEDLEKAPTIHERDAFAAIRATVNEAYRLAFVEDLRNPKWTRKGPPTEAPSSLFERYLALTKTDRWYGIVLYAERDFEGTVIRAGDFVAARWWEAAEDPRGVRATVFPVPRSQLAAADTAIESGALREIGIPREPSWGNSSPMARIRAKLRRPQRTTWSDSTSPLLIVRPIAEHVSEPVVADTDAAAIFELLHQVGGRMPKEGRGSR